MKRPILIAAVIAAFFFVSCKNGSTNLPIPKDAAMVVRINSSSLLSKLKWEDIKATQWFKDGAEDARDSFQKKLLDNPETSGIDIKSDFVMFMTKKGKSSYIVFEGNLKDASAFENMLKKMDSKVSVEKDGDLSFVKPDHSSLTSWTNSKFFIASDVSEHDNSYYSNYDENKKASTDSLKKFIHGLLDLKSGDNLSSDDRFTTLLKENGDMHFWMNTEQYMSDMPSIMKDMEDNPMMSVIQSMSKLYRGNISTGVLSFDDGKITVRSKQYLGEEMKKIFDKFEFKPVTQELVNRIPFQNVVGAMVANYPPEASREMLRATGLDGLVNSFLKKYGYSLDELMSAVKGQMIISLNDFSRTTVEKQIPGSNYSYPMVETNVDLVFGMSINNKSSFDKLISIAESQLDSSERNEMLSRISYKTTNDWFAVGTSAQTVDKFLAGGNNNVPFAGKISGHSFGAYVDLQKVNKSFQSIFEERTGISDTTANMWQDIVITGGDYKNGTTTSEFTINMIDKSTNSLKQINNYIEKLYVTQKKKSEERFNSGDETTLDSLAVPPVENLPQHN